MRVHFPEDTSKTYLLDSHTTAQEILNRIFERYDLEETNEYGLYVVLSTGHVALPILPSDKVMDILYLADMLMESLQTSQDGKLSYQIDFVRKLWLEQPLNTSESLLNLIYSQLRKDFIKGHLFSQVELEAGSLSLIAELVAMQVKIHLGGATDSKKTHHSFIPEVIYGKLQPAEWEKLLKKHAENHVNDGDIELKQKFVETLKTWDLFGASFFGIKASNDPRFSSGGLLVVDGVGIKVLERNSRQTIISYGYDEIVNFRYDDNEFVMRTGDLMQKRIIRCQTTQGFVIADLIHSYVQYHMSMRVGDNENNEMDVNRNVG